MYVSVCVTKKKLMIIIWAFFVCDIIGTRGSRSVPGFQGFWVSGLDLPSRLSASLSASTRFDSVRFGSTVNV